MTMSGVADLRKHNDHLIMSFVIQAIANHLIIFSKDVNPTCKFMQLVVETKLRLSSDEA